MAAILERERVIKMTKQDAEVFFDAIRNPPPINHKLLMAMQAYQEAFPNAENRGLKQSENKAASSGGFFCCHWSRGRRERSLLLV